MTTGGEWIALEQQAAAFDAEIAAAMEPPAPPRPENAVGLDVALAMLVAGVGNAICARVEVPPLAEVEATAIGKSLAAVAELYGVRPADPRIEAWLGLAGAVAGPILSRLDAFRAARDARADLAKKPAGPAPAEWDSSEAEYPANDH